MADRIGVLDAVSLATVATHTAYTCPPGCSAKVRILFRGVAGTNSTLAVLMNGIKLFTTPAATSGNILHSTYSLIVKETGDVTIAGSSDATTIAPFQRDYFLSAGDTVQYTIGTAAFSAMDFQVVGTEVQLPT